MSLEQQRYRTWCRLLAAGSCLWLSACDSKSDSPKPATTQPEAATATTFGPIAFDDLTAASGLDSVYRNGYEAGENAILESLGGGVGLLDFDNDGRTDVFLPTGGNISQSQQISGLPNQLFRSTGSFQLRNVSRAAQVDAAGYYTHGCAIADADHDGFPDILVTGYGGLQFFHNQGDGTFVECADSLGLQDDQWSSSAAWGDFNQDGILDLYVTHYVDWSWQKHPKCTIVSADVYDICSPHQFNGLSDVIFLGTPAGTYTKHADDLGLVKEGKGLGVIVSDVDLDGDVDIYVANDTVNNFFYLNDGQAQFEELGLVSGLATDADGVPNGSMGLAVLDYKNDLLPDLWVTNYENETFGLYENVDHANFKSVSELAGVTALGTLFVGFGTVAADFDLDGDEDICVANGHVINFPKTGTPGQEQLLLRNTGRRLERVSFPSDSYFGQLHWGRSVVTTDLDGDGRPDLLFSNSNQPAAILQNTTPTPAQHWLQLHLIGRESNRNAIGAYAIARTRQGQQLRCVVGGGSYLSQNLYRLHWGLGTADTVEEVTIYWPSGVEQTLQELAIDQTHTVVEPE